MANHSQAAWAVRGTGDRQQALREPAGAWVWDVPAERLYADARFAALCNLDPEAARAGLPTQAFVAAVAPDDRLRVRIAVAGILRGSETFGKDSRVRRSDGGVRLGRAR